MPLLWGTKAADRGILESLLWIVVFSLWGFGIHRARRYRLSRTRWRGIRAGLSGRSAPFAWTYLWTTVLIPITLGWILPWRAARLQRVLFNETCFGDKAFAFTGRAGPLYKRFWLVWVSAIVLFGAVLAAIGAVLGPFLSFPGVGPPRMGAISREKIAAVVAIVFAALLIFAMIRAWYSSRMFNYFASETHLPGQPVPPRHDGAEPRVAGRQQLSHSRAVAHHSLAHRRSARHALHRRPALARWRRSSGRRWRRIPMRC